MCGSATFTTVLSSMIMNSPNETAAVTDLGVEFFESWAQVCDDSRGPEWATWFVGGKLNVAWNCVHRWAEGPRAGAPAAVFRGEDGGRRMLSFAELSRDV